MGWWLPWPAGEGPLPSRCLRQLLGVGVEQRRAPHRGERRRAGRLDARGAGCACQHAGRLAAARHACASPSRRGGSALRHRPPPAGRPPGRRRRARAPPRRPPGAPRILDRQRRDVRVRRADAEPLARQFGAQRVGVVGEPLDPPRLASSTSSAASAAAAAVGGRPGGSGHRPGGVDQMARHRVVAAHIAAVAAERGPQRAAHDVDLAVEPGVRDGAAAARTEHAEAVRLVREHADVVTARQRHESRQRARRLRRRGTRCSSRSERRARPRCGAPSAGDPRRRADTSRPPRRTAGNRPPAPDGCRRRRRRARPAARAQG